jgi:hypothetical protein
MFTRLLGLLLCLLTAACVQAPRQPAAEGPAAEGWQAVPLPGKPNTEYRWVQKEGRQAIAAASDGSASMLRRRVSREADALGEVSFSWWVNEAPENSSVAHADREDAPARVLFGFHGDVSSLPTRTRMMFELAEALTGERPPYATLRDVWDATAPVGTVIVNPRSDRIRKIVVDSGPEARGRWREHRRNLADDFRLAFGEAPGRLDSIAVMTDTDNTKSRARSWYGPVELH